MDHLKGTSSFQSSLYAKKWSDILRQGVEVTTETTKSVEIYYTHKDGDDLCHTVKLYESCLDVPQDRCDDDRKFKFPLFRRNSGLTYHFSGVVKVGQVTVDHTGIDLNTIPTAWHGGKQYWKLDFELKIQFSAASGVLEFSSWIKGQKSGTTNIKYGKD